jgi:magnesium transporter
MTTHRSHKSGLAPGSLVYIGEPRSSAPRIRRTIFSSDTYEETEYDSWNPAILDAPSGSVVWLDIDGIHDVPFIEQLGASCNLHPLMLEDLLNTTKRPKLEEFDETLFVLLKACHPGPSGKRIITEQVSLVLTPTLAITFQEKNAVDIFKPIRDRIRNGKGRIRKSTVDYLAYSLLDAIVDSYFSGLELIGERVEKLEQEALTKPTERTLAEIYKSKRVIMQLRRALWPLREMISQLVREESAHFTASTQVFLRDIYDHVVELVDILEGYREMSAALMEIYLSGLSNRMNNVMMLLAMVSTVFMPLSFIAGLYGMNFQHMPELSWKYGYPLVLSAMLAVAIFMLTLFKRRGWL